MRTFFIISLLLGILSGFFLKGLPLVLSLAAIYLILCALPVGIFLLFWWALEFHLIRESKEATTYSTLFSFTRRAFLTLTCSVILSCGLSFGIGSVVQHWLISNTRSFVEKTVPKLDEYREQHGRFPDSLSELEDVHVPYFSAKGFRYIGNHQMFTFEYGDSDRMYDASDWMRDHHSFDSLDRQWTFNDIERFD